MNSFTASQQISKSALIYRVTLLAICLLLVVDRRVTSQEETPMPSLMESDICNPPCWFGLTPGASTLEDVLLMFGSKPDRFYNEFVDVDQTEDGLPIVYLQLNLEPLIENQSIDFFWSVANFEGSTNIGNVIRLSGNRVAMMAIKPTELVSLREILSTWGQPVTIRAGSSLYYDYLLFYYREPQIIVQLDTADEAHVEEECKIADLIDVFRVEHIYYLSSSAYREEARYWLQASHYVPDRLWESWLAGEVKNSCTRAITALRD